VDRKTYLWVAGVIFALVALFHLVRIFEDWPVVVGIVAGGLALFGLRFTEDE
jgi:hypothetical protein